MRKNKKKKKLSKLTLISILIGGVTGALIAIFGNPINFIKGFVSPPIYIIILIIVLTFILSVTLHEFGHAISFIINGIKMRGIIFVNFLLIKENNKWKFKIIRNKSLGGIAIPKITNIKNEKEFLQIQKSFAKALLAGPMASIVSWIALTLIGLIIINNSTNLSLNSGIWVFIITLAIITFFIVFSSFFKNDMVIGDFPAYKTAKNNKYFTGMQLYNYGCFSSNPEKSRKENIYLREFIIKELKEKYEKKDFHWFTLSMVDTILVEYLSGFLKELPRVVEDYIDLILKKPNILSDIKRTQEKEIMYFHLIMYLYRNENTKERAFLLYKDIKKLIKPDTPKREYLFNQVEHMLGVSNNEKFLRDNKNIVNTDMHFIFKHFPGFFIDEIKINESIT